MKKIVLLLCAASIASFSCLQGKALGNSSLLMQIAPMLASLKRSPDPTQIVIGDNGLVQAFKGKKLQADIKVFDGYMLTDRQNYTYTRLIGPNDLSISADGIIEYNILSDAETKTIPISVLVKNKTTGKSYTQNAQLVIMATEVVASGIVGPQGGQIADEWNDIVITVPEGAVEGQTLIEVLRAVDGNGYYAYTIKASAPLLKILQMRLPDPILRKAPEGSAVMLQSKRAFQQAQRGDEAQASANSRWFNWQFWSARYIEITTGINAENRLRNDLPDNLEPEHPDINHNVHPDAAALFSLCSHDAYSAECGSKDPVVFIHGYTAGGNLGGGEDTWGKLPELIAAEGYAVFEFRWRTNARFEDVAANFADAIGLIQKKSKKKVHIVAHSFGGLVSRAYLQNYATGRPYQNNVQSFLTFGTPHSGIFDTDGTYHELFFKKGQDSDTFEGCMQLSCQEAGEPTPDSWTIKQLTAPSIQIYPAFGINVEPGEFISKIQKTSDNHVMPVDTLVLMGLPRKHIYYSTGDGLITYAGQRFNMTWGDSKIHSGTVNFNSIKVTEKILGVSDYDPDAVPMGTASQSLLNIWSRSGFKGYFHSPAIPDYINFYPYGAAEAYVDACVDTHENVIACENFKGTNAPHAALTEIKAWLKSKSSEVAEPLNITLNLKVIDESTQLPVSGAEVYFNIGSSCTVVPNYTDSAGMLSVELPFYPTTQYNALVRANGYRSGEFDTDYTTGSIPALSGTEFGTIKLKSDLTKDYLKASKHTISGNESVHFDYDFNGTNCSIDFSDGTQSNLPSCSGSIDHVFAKEWVYGVKLYSNAELIDEEVITVPNPTDDWIGFVVSDYYHENININDILHDGRLYLAPSLSEASYYWTHYRYINPSLLKAVSGDDFSLEERIKVPSSEGGISCYDPSLAVVGEGGATASVTFMSPGCTYYAGIGTSGWWHSGGYSSCDQANSTCEIKDLSALGKDFSDWKIIKLKVKDGTVSAYYENELLYSMQYKGKVGNIYGLSQYFKGSGSIDWIKLYDGGENLIYSEDFNR